MDWSEATLLEQTFIGGAGRGRLVARLGFPRPTEHSNEWACSFQLAGSKDARTHVAHGADGLQAVIVAASTIRQWLDKIRLADTGEPYEFIFPKVVPISYGLEFHRYLCTIIDEQVKKKERQLTRKRLSRKRNG